MYRLRPEQIRALRKARKLSLDALASASQIGRHTLCRWEKQPLTSFDFNLIHQLARHYGVSVFELTEETNAPRPQD